MKKTFGLLALSAALLTTGCVTHEPFFQGTNVNINKNQGDILGTLVVFNKNEIGLARLARTKTHNPMVRSYAHMIAADHSANLQATEALAQKLDLPLHKDAQAMNLQSRGHKEWQELNRSNHFNRDFAEAMVKGHEDALSLLEHLSHTNNPAIRQHIMNTRAHVLVHLQKAQILQKELAR